jgi:hypothetical protein
MTQDKEVDLWTVDNIQFPRLLAEIRAVGLTPTQRGTIARSMDLHLGDIDELFERAEKAWERIKEAHTGSPEEKKRAINRMFRGTLTLGEIPDGVCFNCLNGAHGICDDGRCKCRRKKHVAWWWVKERKP